MSLMRAIARLTAVAALRGITLAEMRVYDSDNTPLNEAIVGANKPLPYITVYTDEDIRSGFSGKDVYTPARELALVLEIAAASQIKIEGETDSGDVAIPATDSGLELGIDVLESQAIAALLGNPQNKWGELFRDLVVSIARIPTTRGASGAQGARWAARQITFRLDVIADLPPGVPVPAAHIYRKFVALARSDTAAKMVGAAGVIEAALTRPGGVGPTWEQAQSWMSVTHDAIDAIGLAPLLNEPQDRNEGPELTEANPDPQVWTLPSGEEIPDYWPKPGVE